MSTTDVDRLERAHSGKPWVNTRRTPTEKSIAIAFTNCRCVELTVSGWSPANSLFIFIVREHTDARYRYSNSVCPSVRNVPVLDAKGLTYCHSFFSPYESSIILVYKHHTFSRNSAKYGWDIKISRFSTNKSLYLANDTRYRYSYYRKEIGNRTQAVEWHQFQ